MRGEHQGGNEGNDPGAAGRRVSFRGCADDLSQVRKRFDRRSPLGESVLTARNFTSSEGAQESATSAEVFAAGPNGLRCEGLALSAIAGEVGTPCYVYSSSAIRSQYERLRDAVKAV